MKTSILAALGLAALVQAQGTLPPCATTCALNAIGATGCQVTDAACICTKQAFLTSVNTCIQGACDAADIKAALDYAVSFCGAAGITISTPGASGAASGSASASSAPASSAPASSTPESSAPASSAAETSKASSVAPASSPPASQTTGGGQSQAATSAPASTFTGAAATAAMQQNLVGGLLGLGMGVVAAL